jgi:hypothetical protein|nr:MAG TPA: meiotically up-regulated protein 113 [Caudoviricetes sp.]
MNNIQIFNNEQFGEIRVVESDGNIYFIQIKDCQQVTYTIFDFLSIAYKAKDSHFSEKLITLLDCYAGNNNTYWGLRQAVMYARCANEIRHETIVKYGNCKTYLMRDLNTGLTKIGKSISPSARERTLQSEKPTISLFKISDSLIERELHELFRIKRVRGEWFNLTDDDIEHIVMKYNFK